MSSQRILGRWILEQGVLWYLGEEWPDQEFPLAQSGEFLRVVATPATHEKVAEFIGLIERRALRTVVLEAFVLPAASVAEQRRSVLTPSEVETLLAGATPLDRSRASVPFGRVAALGASSVQSVLYDFDVEVATYTEIADPAVTAVQEGTQIGAVVRELADGRLLLRTWGRRGFMHEAIREIELEFQQGLGDWQRESIVFGSGPAVDAEGEARPQLPRRAFIEVIRSTRADLSLVIRPVVGEWTLLACQSLPHTDKSFVAVLRAEVLGGE